MQYPSARENDSGEKRNMLREHPAPFRGMDQYQPLVPAGIPAGSRHLDAYFTAEGLVDITRLIEIFHMSKAQLAETAGLPLSTVTKSDRMASPKAQNRMAEMLEIINRIKSWAGSEAQAMAWYRSQPIPALDGRTCEALVKSGDAAAVREYLDHMALGGFA